MHLFMLTRAPLHQLELWKTFLQAQMFPWKRQPLLKDKKGNYIKNKDGTYKRGKEEVDGVQGALRPIQLWEYVFPEESLGDVLAMLNLHDPSPYTSISKTKRAMLRKMLKAKPVPAMPDATSGRYIEQRGVAMYPMGIRKDPKLDFPDFGYYQEGL